MNKKIITLIITSTSLAIPFFTHAAIVNKTISPTSLTSGLVGHWTMDGKDTVWTSATAGTVVDKSGNGNTGTLTNMARSTSPALGKVGQALNFDGSNDYIPIGNSSNYYNDTQTQITVNAWMKTTQASEGRILTLLRASGSSGIGLGINRTAATANRAFSFYRDSSNSFKIIESTNTANDGKWHLLTFVISGTSGYLYVDGTLQTTVTDVHSVNTFTSGAFASDIGSYGSGSNLFNGSIDDVRIYNRALSTTEIAQLYNLSASKYNATPPLSLTSGLVGHWTMDGKDVVNGVALDRSGGGKSGNLVNISTSTFYTIGKLGQAFNFDGVNDYVVNSLSGTTLTQLSISFWSNPSKVDSAQRGVFQWAHFLTSTVPFILIVRESNTTNYKLYVDGGYQISCAIPNNTWSYFTVTLNSSNLWTVYKNGVACGSTYQDDATHGSQSNAAGVYIGNGFNDFFSGKIDDVRIYNRALSTTEITQLYNQGK